MCITCVLTHLGTFLTFVLTTCVLICVLICVHIYVFLTFVLTTGVLLPCKTPPPPDSHTSALTSVIFFDFSFVVFQKPAHSAGRQRQMPHSAGRQRTRGGLHVTAHSAGRQRTRGGLHVTVQKTKNAWTGRRCGTWLGGVCEVLPTS
jgi:hypothetical protein